MKSLRNILVLMFGLTLAAVNTPLFANPEVQPAGQQTPAADNTKANAGDQDKGAITADQQKQDRTDRVMAKRIRRAIVEDKTLSTYAHNVKVIVRNGSVTLKGPVRSEDEKAAVETKAAQVAGGSNVTNDLEVQPKM